NPKSEMANRTKAGRRLSSDLRFRISDLRCRIRPISKFPPELAARLPVLLMLCVTTHDNRYETECQNRSVDVEFPHFCGWGAPRSTDGRRSCHYDTHVRGRHRERTGFLSRRREARRKALQCGLQSPGRARTPWHHIRWTAASACTT